MSKDPAFLFYSKDFYEGTRTMLPEERACYIDLLIYQHQNGIIPNDMRRLTMYCSGCGQEVVNQVLNQKFNQTVDGWSNQKLTKLKDERAEHRPKKIASGTLAGLISAAKFDEKTVKTIKSSFKVEDMIRTDNVILSDLEIKQKVREWLTTLVNHMVDNKAIVNANAIVIEDVNENIKGSMREKQKNQIDKIAAYFNVNEVTTSRIYFNISKLVRSHEEDVVFNQFEAYREYKSKSEEIVHSVTKWIGQLDDFSDGAWCHCDWTEKLRKIDSKNSKLVKDWEAV